LLAPTTVVDDYNGFYIPIYKNYPFMLAK